MARLVGWFDGGPKHGQTMWLQRLDDPLIFFDRARQTRHDPTAPAPMPLVEYRLTRVAGNVAFYECRER